ncbi:MAG: DUF3098 domain-containing protein [Chitinophagaceae bacterium]
MAERKESKIITETSKWDSLFGRSNYILMLISIFLVILGCLLMMGGRTDNPHEFNYNEIFSFRRITLAPLCIMIGFIMAIYGILKNPKNPS